jgi:predicted DNA-binding protein YlxM (UPF0122 family)
MSGPWSRTVKRDLNILLVYDQANLSPKEIARVFCIKACVVYEAIRRRRNNPTAYQVEQVTETHQKTNIESERSNALE